MINKETLETGSVQQSMSGRVLIRTPINERINCNKDVRRCLVFNSGS